MHDTQHTIEVHERLTEVQFFAVLDATGVPRHRYKAWSTSYSFGPIPEDRIADVLRVLAAAKVMFTYTEATVIEHEFEPCHRCGVTVEVDNEGDYINVDGTMHYHT